MAITTVKDLIFRAYRDAGIIGADRDVTGYEADEGLDRLNMLIANLYSSSIYIPFYESVKFTLKPDQAEYVIDQGTAPDVNHAPLVSLEFCTVELGGVKYPVEVLDYADYYQLPKIDSTASIPSQVLLFKTPNSSKIIFYYKPSEAYPCELIGKFQTGEWTLTTKLTSLALIYRRFLQFALSRELNAIYHVEQMPAYIEEEYQRMFARLKSESPFNGQSWPNQFFRSGHYREDIRNGGWGS